MATTTIHDFVENALLYDWYHSPEMASEYSNSPNEIVESFSGILFDMDGTLIDSTNAIVKFWTEIGRNYGIDPQTILATSHGRRSIDVFKQIDPLIAKWKYIRKLEAEIPACYGSDATEIPGARDLLNALTSCSVPWAIVTSGTQPLVQGWLEALSLSAPEGMVTAEDVLEGKPDPACYVLGQKRIGGFGEGALVAEDAPAGIRAGKGAGLRVLAVASTHSLEELVEAGADWVVRDLESVELVGVGGMGMDRRVVLSLRDVWFCR